MICLQLLSRFAIVFCAMGSAQAQSLSVAAHPQRAPVTSMSKADGEKVGALFMAMCFSHFAQGKLAWAEQACGQAIEADPHLADAYKLRGYAYLMEHRFERAQSDFRTALRLKPQDDQNIAGYAESLNGMGRFAQAAVQFRRALSLMPERAAYWNGLCWAKAGEGRQLQVALDSCNRALALAPGAAGILNSRGMVYLHLRRFALARGDYSASLKVEPGQASAWFGRGFARLSLGEKNGSSDIAEARHRDPEVDKLFVQMGVLAPDCQKAAGPLCPPDFPVAPPRQPNTQVAMLHADPDQELVLEIRPGYHSRLADAAKR